MSESVVNLSAARRARDLRDARRLLALVVYARPSVVHLLAAGAVEFLLDPDVGEIVALEILEACKAAREGRS